MIPIAPWFRLLVFAVLLVAIAFWIDFSDESFRGSPGRQGDDVYFENIAYHLAKGEGIRFDFTDETWRKAYREANPDGVNDWVFHLKVRGATTSRSPGLPLVAAGIYRLVGRDFLAVRIVLSLSMAAAMTLLVVCVSMRFGWLVGAMATVTLSLDYFLLRTTGQFMTEGPGAILVSLIFCAILHLTDSQRELSRLGRAIGWTGVGLLYGFGILVRANLNAWLLLAIVGLAGLILIQAIRRRPIAWLVVPAAYFGLGVVIVSGPWWVRNCVVSKAFCPFGTSGSFGLAGGYSDIAFSQWGNWDPQAVDVAQATVLARPGIFSKSLAEQEFEMGIESTRMARQWVSDHSAKVPWLMLYKACSHLGFYRQPAILMWINGLLYFGALLGCAYAWRWFGFWAALIVVLSLVSTMLTWEHFGRYSIPIRPLVHAACAVGTVSFWRMILSARKQKLPARSVGEG